MDKKTFEILRNIAIGADLQDTGYGSESIGETVAELENAGYISEGKITPEGYGALEPYKVTNAIIMAAGLSVRGEVLIERQIRQLQEAGIDDIYVVVGYLKEQFYYLEEKFGVKIVINDDYARRNNNGSIWMVKDQLANSYICSSDDYFTENVFEPYVYEGYYAMEFMKGKTTERGAVIDEEGRIIRTYPGAEDAWALMGHAYWNREFSESFVKHLEEIYFDEETKPLLWERIYDRYMDVLPPLYARKYNSVIYEFDAIQELKDFDPDFLADVDSAIMDNICGVLECRREELNDFALLNGGQTNSTFTFTLNGREYVYRHCFPFLSNIVDRVRESAVQKIVTELGVDNTCIYIDPETGWKLSWFIEHTALDFKDEEQLRAAIEILRKIHGTVIGEEMRMDFKKEILKYYGLMEETGGFFEATKNELHDMIFKLIDHVEAEEWPLSITHNDVNWGNYLVHDGKYDLIDWEYAGLNDKAYDIAKLVLKTDAKGEEAHEIISKYYGRECTPEEERHILACGAIEEYHWALWASYLEQNGRDLKRDRYIWYTHAKEYGKIASEMYESRT